MTIKGYRWKTLHEVIDPAGNKLIAIVEVTGTVLEHSLATCRARVAATPHILDPYLSFGAIIEATVREGGAIGDDMLDTYATVLEYEFENADSDTYLRVGKVLSLVGRKHESLKAYRMATARAPHTMRLRVEN